MRAMVLQAPREALLEQRVPSPRPGFGQLLIRVRACGVCRTDLHVCDGELVHAKQPLILGHQIVGTVAVIGDGVEGFTEGQRVGVPWLGRACGDCRYCRSDRENLCDRAQFTGYQLDGGYAEYTVAEPRFALPLPGSFSDLQAAPLLCAGLIGYRALSLTYDAERVGLYGFGSSAHIVAQVAAFQGRKVFAFTRPGDLKNQEFAKKLGAVWAGGSDLAPPEVLDALRDGDREFTLARDNVRDMRKTRCYPNLQEFQSGLSTQLRQQLTGSAQKVIGENSSYFRADIWVTIGTTRFTLYSLLYRAGGSNLVRPILRSFGTT